MKRHSYCICIIHQHSILPLVGSCIHIVIWKSLNIIMSSLLFIEFSNGMYKQSIPLPSSWPWYNITMNEFMVSTAISIAISVTISLVQPLPPNCFFLQTTSSSTHPLLRWASSCSHTLPVDNLMMTPMPKSQRFYMRCLYVFCDGILCHLPCWHDVHQSHYMIREAPGWSWKKGGGCRGCSWCQESLRGGGRG